MADLTPHERKTVQMFGKPYHWERDADGDLVLRPGVAPNEQNLTFTDLLDLPMPEDR